MGALNDGKNSIVRYALGNFYDGYNQVTLKDKFYLTYVNRIVLTLFWENTDLRKKSIRNRRLITSFL